MEEQIEEDPQSKEEIAAQFAEIDARVGELFFDEDEEENTEEKKPDD